MRAARAGPENASGSEIDIKSICKVFTITLVNRGTHVIQAVIADDNVLRKYISKEYPLTTTILEIWDTVIKKT